MHVPLRPFFPPADSEEARAKLELLADHRLIAPGNDAADPKFRITWDKIEEHIKTCGERMASRLAEAPGGGELALVLSAMSTTCPLLVFVGHMTEVIKSIFSEWDSGLGFDLDAFFQIDNEEDPSSWRAIAEAFPRNFPFPVTHPATFITAQVPVFFMSAPVNEHPYDFAGSLIVGEHLRGQDALKALVSEWVTHRGVWYLRQAHLVDHFLDRLALSFNESDGRTQDVVVPGVTRDLNGRLIGASLRFV